MIQKLFTGIGPEKGLTVLRELIAERLGHKVERYEMRMFCDDSKIDFLVYLPESVDLKTLHPETAFKYNNEKRCNLYKFTDGEKLCKVVLYFFKMQLPADYQLQYVIVKYDQNAPIVAEAYGLNKGVKEKQTITI